MSSHLIALACALVFNATANLLLKFAARDLTGGGNLLSGGVTNALRTAATCPKLIFGLLFFALNVPLYFYALGKFKVSLAYPVMIGGGFAIIVLIASFSGLNERLSASQWLGVVLILLGVTIVSSQLTK